MPVQTGQPLICKTICCIKLLSHFRLLHKYPVFTRNQVRHGSWQPGVMLSSIPFQLSTASLGRFSYSFSCSLLPTFLPWFLSQTVSSLLKRPSQLMELRTCLESQGGSLCRCALNFFNTHKDFCSLIFHDPASQRLAVKGSNESSKNWPFQAHESPA